jgi:hypothetical protein
MATRLKMGLLAVGNVKDLSVQGDKVQFPACIFTKRADAVPRIHRLAYEPSAGLVLLHAPHEARAVVSEEINAVEARLFSATVNVPTRN